LYATSLAFSPDGKTLAAACVTIPILDPKAKEADLYRPGLVRLWDMTQSPPKPLAPLEHISTKAGRRDVFGGEETFRAFGINPIVVAFAPDSESVAVGTFGTSDDSEYLWLWDLKKKPPRPRTLGGAHWNRVEALAFAPNRKSLASGGFDGTIRIWDLTLDPPRPGPAIHATDMKTSKEGPITGGTDVAVLSLVFSPDSNLLAASCGDSYVRLWDVTKSPPAAPTRLDWGSPDPVRCAFSSDGRLIATVGSDHDNGKPIVRLILWDVASKQPRRSFDLPAAGPFVHVAFAPDGRHVVVGTERGIYVLRIRAASPKK
jgi:WD40 repeat protein